MRSANSGGGRRSGLDRQHLVVAAQAAADVLECPRDAARGVEIEHAAVAHEHVDVGRHLHQRLLAAHGRRSLQAVRALLGPDERELGAVERQPVDRGLSPVARRSTRSSVSKPTFALRAVKNGVASPDRADADVAKRELRAAPAQSAVEPRVVEREPELGRDPGLNLVLVARQPAQQQLEPADAERDERDDRDQRDRRYPYQFAHDPHGRLHQHHVELIRRVERLALQPDRLTRDFLELGDPCRVLVEETLDDLRASPAPRAPENRTADAGAGSRGRSRGTRFRPSSRSRGPHS